MNAPSKSGRIVTFLSRAIIFILGIPAIILLTWNGGIPFFILIALIALIAQMEYYHLQRCKAMHPYDIPGILGGLVWLAMIQFWPAWAIPVLLCIFVLFFLGSLWHNPEGVSFDLSTTVLGFVYIPFFLSTLLYLRGAPEIHSRAEWVIMLLVSLWACDTFAYIFGSLFGKVPIAPKLSPRKTLEGTVAGLFGALLVPQIFFLFGWIGASAGHRQLLVFGLLIGIFGQLGDLIESALKRDAKVKDSGHLLLGHGGVLDRFDSLFLAAPVIYIYLHYVL